MNWEDEPVWTCGVCAKRGPCFYIGWWRDDQASTSIPGGSSLLLPVRPRCTELCSKACALAFAKAAGNRRISIRRPATERWWREHLARGIDRVVPQPVRAA